MSRIGGIGSEVGPIEVAREPRPLEQVGGTRPGSFADALGEALRAVDAQQGKADVESARLAMGGGNLHEVALALEKADLSMRVATKVRNRLVDAYQEIMRMSV
jgi:flagellar hook-basal body complex protein FliE